MGGLNWTEWLYHNQFSQLDGLLIFLKGQFDTCAIFDDLLNFHPESINLVPVSLTNVCRLTKSSIFTKESTNQNLSHQKVC